ncbi:hypothetical protein SH2C18_19520 [Clostridium sediminicola]
MNIIVITKIAILIGLLINIFMLPSNKIIEPVKFRSVIDINVDQSISLKVSFTIPIISFAI